MGHIECLAILRFTYVLCVALVLLGVSTSGIDILTNGTFSIYSYNFTINFIVEMKNLNVYFNKIMSCEIKGSIILHYG